MAWNQPSDNDKPRASTDATRGKGLEDTLRRWQRRFDGFGGSGGPQRVVWALLAIALCAWFATGLYSITATERAVVLRFGRVVAELGPGTGLRWPWPIETVLTVDVDTAKSVEYQTRELTADVAAADVGCLLQYRYADLRRVLLAKHDVDARVRAAGERALRESIGATGLALLLAEDQRAALGQAVRERAQQLLDAEGAGVRVAAVQINDVQMPSSVQPAQRELAKATTERARGIEEARVYAATVLPKAKAEAERLVSEAQAARAQTIASAEAQAAHFSALVPAYSQAPEVTRQRLYIETMESILSHARKIIVDTRAGSGGSMIYLPLDKLLDAGARLPPAAATSSTPSPSPATAPASAGAAPADAAGTGAGANAADRERGRDRRVRESR
jgi:membrane protease subunit HflK